MVFTYTEEFSSMLSIFVILQQNMKEGRKCLTSEKTATYINKKVNKYFSIPINVYKYPKLFLQST